MGKKKLIKAKIEPMIMENYYNNKQSLETLSKSIYQLENTINEKEVIKIKTGSLKY